MLKIFNVEILVLLSWFPGAEWY